MSNQDIYKTLGIDPSATDEETRAAYRKRIRKFHPDVSDLNIEEANAKTKEILEAYNAIKEARRDRHNGASVKDTAEHRLELGSGLEEEPVQNTTKNTRTPRDARNYTDYWTRQWSDSENLNYESFFENRYMALINPTISLSQADWKILSVLVHEKMVGKTVITEDIVDPGVGFVQTPVCEITIDEHGYLTIEDLVNEIKLTISDSDSASIEENMELRLKGEVVTMEDLLTLDRNIESRMITLGNIYELSNMDALYTGEFSYADLLKIGEYRSYYTDEMQSQLHEVRLTDLPGFLEELRDMREESFEGDFVPTTPEGAFANR